MESGFGLLFHVLVRLSDGRGVGGNQELFLVGRLVVDLDAHVAERGDDGFDLLRVDQVVRQVVVDLGVRRKPRSLPSLIRFLRRVRRVGVFLRHLGRDEPGVLAAAAATAALTLDLRDLGFEELERLLGALDGGFRSALGGLVVGFRRRRRLRRSGLARLEEWLFRRDRLARRADFGLQTLDDLGLLLGRPNLLHFAALLDHPSPGLTT